MRRSRSFLSDFREFIMRGNVVDLAVAVIIGGAFGQIVNSFVEDIVTPLILNPALQAANVDDLARLQANGIKYGLFLSAVLNFLVISLVIFLMIRALEAAKRRFIREEAAAEEPADPVLAAQERLTSSIDRLTQTIDRRTI
ncbi:large conductance mechanosensitive channel protein MscL [Microcoleus sp. FACHB-1515]|uniref:large conductance mechanosensitive channel protein MscL n=1 Tax=Cyanophyceae TaxID=3028117 RepID=UPI00168597B4|nr:large conductance mechanosensitive channel protein MscL [Microcoleus sp. FACHB-1515]MBD2089917.1 large conductance mechanosensitive channel protein MscL [Microcoleus sp. FACHB-1515]